MPWPKVARAVFLSRPVAGAVSQSDPSRGASNLTGRRNCEPVKPRNSPPRESDCGMIGSVEPVTSRRRPRRHRDTGQVAMFEVPGVGEDGMSGRNVQRKLGTTRGSPRRSRTAKASRISRRAVKSRCAREWGGWGRLSDDGPGHYNPDPSEGPWGRWSIPPHGGAVIASTDPTLCGSNLKHEGRRQTGRRAAYAGSRLKLIDAPGRSRLTRQPFSRTEGKPAVRNVRGDRGNVGIIRSPIRASILPDPGVSRGNSD